MASQEDPELRRILEGEVQRAQFQQQALSLTDMCWTKCIDKIGRLVTHECLGCSHLSKTIGNGSDKKTDACLVNCVERFLDVTTFVVERFQAMGGSQ
jgi:import inner membrane translocase subunit TIM8